MTERSAHNLFIHSGSSGGGGMGMGAMGRALKEAAQSGSGAKRERWLLTRKTWRYMTDAGRRLVPEGAHNLPEDVPAIERYFQHVCSREPRFLLWRKASYPGALAGAGSGGRRNRRRSRDAVGRRSCRLPQRPASADEADDLRKELAADWAASTPSSSSSSAFRPVHESVAEEEAETDDGRLAAMLEKFLDVRDDASSPPPPRGASRGERPHAAGRADDPRVDYRELVDRLRQLSDTYQKENKTHTSSFFRKRASANGQTRSARRAQVDGRASEPVGPNKQLYDTLNRHFSRSGNRDKVIGDLLTDRKLLQSLYFDLRRTRVFGANRTAAPPSDFHLGGGSRRIDLLRDSNDEESSDAEGIDRATRLERMKEGEEQVGRRSEAEAGNGERRKRGATLFYEWGTQTEPVSEATLHRCDEEARKEAARQHEEEEAACSPGKSLSPRRRSSVDNDDVSQSVSDTIKRYLRMARKKSSDKDAADRFKRINYDKNLRNIKAKNVVDSISEDDETNKGTQTEREWTRPYREWSACVAAAATSTSDFSSCDELSPTCRSPPSPSPSQSVAASHGGLLSSLQHLLHRGASAGAKHGAAVVSPPAGVGAAEAAAAAMHKSKSSSSVVQHGGRLVANKIFRSRSKSQTRLQQPACPWTPLETCVWTHCGVERRVRVRGTTLTQLGDEERGALRRVALARLQALNLGTPVRLPPDVETSPPPHLSSAATSKTKRTAYLLRRKAKTTGFFDNNKSKEQSDKDGCGGVTGGLVFGIALSQCLENERAIAGGPAENKSGDTTPRLRSSGSRSSFASLHLDHSTRNDDSGSSESLLSRGTTGSVPQLLDALGVATDDSTRETITGAAVPHVVQACCTYLRPHLSDTVGLFRVSSSRRRVRQLRDEFDRTGAQAELQEGQCPHDVATLLKEFLRDLPEPLLTNELYLPFVRTQRIRNRKLQLEAVQLLVQLLPETNCATLFYLLEFLHAVASRSGQNLMDAGNLATVFAPNVLRAPGQLPTSSQEERADVINVVRLLIEHGTEVMQTAAETMHEVYLHLMDSQPQLLDRLLSRTDLLEDLLPAARDAPPDDGRCEVSGAVTWTTPTPQSEQRKTWSREQFLHEFAGTGGPKAAPRERSRGERSSKKRWRDESGTRRRVVDEANAGGGGGGGVTIVTRYGGRGDELDLQTRRQSSSSSVLDNVITASLRIPVSLDHEREDIPYIEEAAAGAGTGGGDDASARRPSAPARRTRQRSVSGSDSSTGSSVGGYCAPAVTGSLALLAQGYDSAVGSSPVSSPPTSPDYLNDVRLKIDLNAKTPVLHKVCITSTGEVQQTRLKTEPAPRLQPQPARKPEQTTARIKAARDQKSISSVGGKVLRSKTEDFEKIFKSGQLSKGSAGTTPASEDKKKYTKRRYTDTRHDTRHIPDAEDLAKDKSTPAGPTTSRTSSNANSGLVYKRRELIASVPKD